MSSGMVPLQLPRSWFKLTNRSCVRRPKQPQAATSNDKNNNDDDDVDDDDDDDEEEEEEEESYWYVHGRLFVADQAVWFNSNSTCDTHCAPLECAPFSLIAAASCAAAAAGASGAPGGGGASFPVQIVEEEDFAALASRMAVLESTGALVLLPASSSSMRHHHLERPSPRKGSFYVVRDQPMLLVRRHPPHSDYYFGLTKHELAALTALNTTNSSPPPTLPPSSPFFLDAALALLVSQTAQQQRALLAQLPPHVSLDTLRKCSPASFPADNEVVHFGLLKKRNKNVGLSSKCVWLALGRLVSLSADGGSGSTVKLADLHKARCRAVGEKQFECALDSTTSTVLSFTCEDRTERDAWMRHVQVCALFSTSRRAGGGPQQLVAYCTEREVAEFTSLVVPVDDLLDVMNRPRGELHPNWRQSGLDFARDRVLVNGREAKTSSSSMQELVLELASAITTSDAAASCLCGDGREEAVMRFIRVLLLASTRTQTGGLVYEALQYVFRSASNLQDRFMISPRSEHVPPIEFTVTSELQHATATHTTASPSPSSLMATPPVVVAAVLGGRRSPRSSGGLVLPEPLQYHLSPHAMSSPAMGGMVTPPASTTAAAAAASAASSASSSSYAKAASDLLPKRGHRRSSSDPQFFKKMMPKYPQPVNTTNTNSPSSPLNSPHSTPSATATAPPPPAAMLDSPRKSPFGTQSRLPPPPVSASAYFRHQRTFSLQKKSHHFLPPELDFHALDGLPAGTVRVDVRAEMDFVVRDCDTNLPIVCVRCTYSREFYLLLENGGGVGVAKDQGQIVLQAVEMMTEQAETSNSSSSSSSSGQGSVVMIKKGEMEEELEEASDDDDVGSVVVVSDDEEDRRSTSSSSGRAAPTNDDEE